MQAQTNSCHRPHRAASLRSRTRISARPEPVNVTAISRRAGAGRVLKALIAASLRVQKTKRLSQEELRSSSQRILDAKSSRTGRIRSRSTPTDPPTGPRAANACPALCAIERASLAPDNRSCGAPSASDKISISRRGKACFVPTNSFAAKRPASQSCCRRGERKRPNSRSSSPVSHSLKRYLRE